jgi:hypothetical protein
MGALQEAFEVFGGVPAELLFDQMKAVIIEDRRERGGKLLASATASWKQFLAISTPIIGFASAAFSVVIFMRTPLARLELAWMTPPVWHINAVASGRSPSHQFGPLSR